MVKRVRLIPTPNEEIPPANSVEALEDGAVFALGNSDEWQLITYHSDRGIRSVMRDEDHGVIRRFYYDRRDYSPLSRTVWDHIEESPLHPGQKGYEEAHQMLQEAEL